MKKFKFEIEDNTEEIIKKTEEAINIALEEIGITAERHAKKNLENTPRRVYTGNLRNSITHTVNEEEHEAIIGTNVEYGIYVHEGTRKMAANRFLRNAIEDHIGEYENRLEKRIKGINQ